MNIESNNIVLIKLDELSLDTLDQLKSVVSKSNDKNVIVNLLNAESTCDQVVTSLVTISEEHQFYNRSFVVVSDTILVEDHKLNTVPTLQEAYDFIEMEDIERDLNIEF